MMIYLLNMVMFQFAMLVYQRVPPKILVFDERVYSIPWLIFSKVQINGTRWSIPPIHTKTQVILNDFSWFVYQESRTKVQPSFFNASEVLHVYPTMLIEFVWHMGIYSRVNEHTVDS